MYKTIRDIKAVNKHYYLAAEDIKKDKNKDQKECDYRMQKDQK